MTDYSKMKTVDQILGLDQKNRNAREIQTSFMNIVHVTVKRFFNMTKRGVWKYNNMYNVDNRLAYVTRSNQFYFNFVDAHADHKDDDDIDVADFNFDTFLNQFQRRTMMSIWNDHGQYQQDVSEKVYHYTEDPQAVRCRNRSKTRRANRYASVKANETNVAHKSDVKAKRTENDVEAAPYQPSKFQMVNPDLFPPVIANDDNDEQTFSSIMGTDFSHLDTSLLDAMDDVVEVSGSVTISVQPVIDTSLLDALDDDYGIDTSLLDALED